MPDPREYFWLEVAYTIPQMEEVTVTKDIIYTSVNGDSLGADVYHPPTSDPAPLPAVIFVHGDAAPEFLKDMKDSGQYVSWGRLVAASGLVAVTFNHRSSRRRTVMHEPASDVETLLNYVLKRAGDFRIDSTRLAIWVCSAGPPYILPYVLRENPPFVRGIVIYYGLLDIQHLRTDTLPEVSDEKLREFSPLHQLRATAGSVPPMLLVRAGTDHSRFNEGIDRFVAAALEKNVSIELINLPDADHGFDVRSDSAEARRVIARTLSFLKAVTSAQAQ